MKKIVSLWLACALMVGIMPALAAEAPANTSSPASYVILVQDAADESPVSGAMIQFCSDTQCMVGLTDASGSAAFEADPGIYTAHVLKAPEGYEPSAEEVELTADSRMATFKLHRTGAAEAKSWSAQAVKKFLKIFEKIVTEVRKALPATGS